MTIEELMKESHTLLEWVEPERGCDPGGEITNVTIYHRASVADCIGLQRIRSMGHNYPLLSEKDLLLDFIAINWAYVPGVMVDAKRNIPS